MNEAIATRTYGIEIECIGLSPQQAAAVVTRAGIRCNSESYNHNTRPQWKVVTDGSLSGGYNGACEVVSPILHGEDGLRQIQVVMDALSAAGATVDRSCGMHVHVGASDVQGRELANILAFYAKFESGIDLLVAPSRRANNADYAGSLVDGVDVNKAIRSFKGAKSSRQSILYAHSERGSKVNVNSLFRHGTVEFRQHQGTLNPQKAAIWIQLVLAIVEHSVRRTGSPPVVKVERTPEQTLSKALGYLRYLIGNDTAKALKQRARDIAKALALSAASATN
jgi:hypothetical protein